jgi:hypothetical protein
VSDALKYKGEDSVRRPHLLMRERIRLLMSSETTVGLELSERFALQCGRSCAGSNGLDGAVLYESPINRRVNAQPGGKP